MSLSVHGMAWQALPIMGYPGSFNHKSLDRGWIEEEKKYILNICVKALTKIIAQYTPRCIKCLLNQLAPLEVLALERKSAHIFFTL